MKILQLESGLFPDEGPLRDSVRVLKRGGHAISRIDVGRLAADDDAAWDAVVKEAMTADKIVTV